jgi:hypothetical protein
MTIPPPTGQPDDTTNPGWSATWAHPVSAQSYDLVTSRAAPPGSYVDLGKKE